MMVRAAPMQRSLVLLAAVALTGCAGVHLVSAPEVGPVHELRAGHRVRVHLLQPRTKVTGHVGRVAADTLVIIPDEGTRQEMTLAAANIRRLDLSRGQRSKAGTGAVFGLVAGAVGGYLAILAFCGDCVGGWPLLGLIPGGSLVGAGLGAGVGALIRSERWHPVSWR